MSSIQEDFLNGLLERPLEASGLRMAFPAPAMATTLKRSLGRIWRKLPQRFPGVARGALLAGNMVARCYGHRMFIHLRPCIRFTFRGCDGVRPQIQRFMKALNTRLRTTPSILVTDLLPITSHIWDGTPGNAPTGQHPFML